MNSGSKVLLMVINKLFFKVDIVRGHMSEKSFSWAFYEHFSFFTETYSLNGTESTKRCLQFFQSYVGLFYAN